MPEAAFYKKSILINEQIGLKFKEETNKVLHFEHSFVWY